MVPLPEPSDEPDEPEESPDEPDEPDPDDPEDPEPSEDPWSPPDDELPPDEPEDPFGAASFDGSVAEGSLEPEDVPLSAFSSEASPLPEESCFWACDDEEMSGCGFAPTPCPVVTRSMTRADSATATMADAMDTATTRRCSFFLCSRRSRARCTVGSSRRPASSARGVRERRAVSYGPAGSCGERRAVFSACGRVAVAPAGPAACRAAVRPDGSGASASASSEAPFAGGT